MASVSLICPVPIARFTREGSFSSAKDRLSQLCALGAQAVVLTDFDDRAGTSTALSELCRHARLLGLSVLLDVRCLYGGVSSPAALIDTAVRQGVCDGFLLTGAEWRFPDVRETVARLAKELPDTLTVLPDVPPERGERPDGAYRATPAAILLTQPTVDPAHHLSCYTGVRHSLVCPVGDAPEHMRCGDLALLLSALLPGVTVLCADGYFTLPPQPTDAELHAFERRRALFREARALRVRFPELSLARGIAIGAQGGALTLTRRLKDGVLTLTASQGEDIPLTERTVQSTPPILSYGMYRGRDGLHLLPYGYALTFTPKAAKPKAQGDTEENSKNENNTCQNIQEMASVPTDADEVTYGKEEG